MVFSLLNGFCFAQNLTRYVDPFIGTGGHGHVFLGASVPFGAVQLGPVNFSEGWDWCSGYHYSDSTIIGFSHTHLSGTGIGDLGDVMVMPATGSVQPAKNAYLSLFRHATERAKPGYYSVKLERYNIFSEMTATERVGLQRHQFPASDSSQFIFNLRQGIGWDRMTKGMMRQLNDTVIEGYRYSTGWAADQRIFFTAILSKPINSFVLSDSGTAIAYFKTAGQEKVSLKVGISPVSVENARLNIDKELPGWNFENIASMASERWNKELGKIRIESSDTVRKKVFYTSLYHTMIAPSLFNDVNGDYLGADKKVYRNASFNNLTTFSLWDTYRAAHPLYTIFQPEKVPDLINSMLAIYQQQGKLPVWHLMGNETNTMPGYSAVQVIADAFLKGFTGFDRNLAYEAVRATAMQDQRGIKFIRDGGYIPADSMVESVSFGLEYAISDWSIAQMALQLHKKADYLKFIERSKNYLKYFDSTTGFVRGKLASGEWRTPFDPFQSVHGKSDFTEGNAWQYTFMIPQDVEGMIEMLGGEKKFSKKLDSLFVVHGDMGAEASADISGLIGMYAHGNEPCHHMTYLYAFVGQPWKTADKIRYIADSLYFDRPAGLPAMKTLARCRPGMFFRRSVFIP